MCIDITGRVLLKWFDCDDLWGGKLGLEGTDQSVEGETLFHCVPFTISSPPHPVLVPALYILLFNN